MLLQPQLEAMPTCAFTPKSFQLLKELKKNNNRDWFQENRQEFQAHLRQPFAEVLLAASERLSDHRLAFSGNSKTMFRQHRDVRFSQNKLPYNLHVSGLLTSSGTKDEDGGLLYLHLNDSGGFMAAGCYQLKTPQLNEVRDAILAEPARFSKIIAGLGEAGFELDREDQVKTMPRGYNSDSDHDLADLIRLKRYLIKSKLSQAAWLNNTIADDLVQLAVTAADLITFIEEALHESA